MSEPLPLDQFVERQLASGRYPNYDALVEDALRLLQERESEAAHVNGEAEEAAPTPARPHKPIWEIAAELLADVPEEVLNRLPVDGAAQHDHYIYGTPKRPA
jgi:putative addiction module CopG family antidote